MSAGSLLEARRHELEHCAYCPKLCRFNCPVSEATGREGLTPWGKMSVAFLAEQGTRPPDPALGAAAFGCTGCGRCQSFCRDHNDVAGSLVAARGVALQAGVAPEGVSALLRRFRRDGSPVGEIVPALESLDGELSTPSNVEAFFPGCVGLVREPYDVRVTQAVGRALGNPLPFAPGVELCCGYPLYAAGDREGFIAQAKRVATRLAGLGRIVVGDPGCAHTLKQLYPEVGVPLRAEVVPLAVRLAEGLATAPARPPLPERVTYHDPCHLARSLGCTEEPRAILRRAVRELCEPAHSGAETVCAGAGGAMAWSMPSESALMARARAAELAEAGPLVVTACPTAKRSLARGGAKVRDLAAVLADWLGISA